MKTKMTYLILMVFAISICACKKDNELQKVIPLVTTVTATASGISSAAVSGKITSDGNSSVTVTGFVYSSNVALPTIADNKIELTDTKDDFNAMLEGLNSGTTYHIRAFATNSVGTGYGEVLNLTTGNAGPVASNVTISGTAEVGKTLTTNYTYTDAENNLEGATSFQWYSATSAEGIGETIIVGATAKIFIVTDSQNGKFIRVSVFPKATAGTETGVEVKSPYTGAIGAETVTFTYNGTPVTYGTITSIKTGRKWLDRNIGAKQTATAINDYLAFGDLFQWGRAADGHQLVNRINGTNAGTTGVNGISSSVPPYEVSSDDSPKTNKFIVDPTFRDWRSPANPNLWQQDKGNLNNPCPAGWRLPTEDEWKAEGITSAADAYSKLSLTRTGRRAAADGAFVFAGEIGFYWTSSIGVTDPSWSRYVNIGTVTSNTASVSENPRGTGQACRCIKN